MASLNLTADELKSLESVRSRLSQLSNSIGSLYQDVFRSNPLPTATSLQASAFILQQNLTSVLDVTSSHADLFQRVAVHPSTNFPGRAHEGVLQTLLRKKPEPDVEGAAERARTAARAAGVGPDSFAGRRAAEAQQQRRRNAYGDVDSDDEEGYVGESDGDSGSDGGGGAPREPAGLGDVWADAREWCVERVARFVREEAADDYTAEERRLGVKAVRTGLRRELDSDEESDEEEEDDDDEMEDAGGPAGGADGVAPGGAPTGAVGVPVEVVMWTAARGEMNAPAYLTAQQKR